MSSDTDGPKWRDASGGKYAIPNGDDTYTSVPGVTTILGALPKQDAFVGGAIKKVHTFMVDHWADDEPPDRSEARNAWYGDTRARDLGSLLHKKYEKLILGDKATFDTDEEQGHGKAFNAWLEDYQPEVIQTEATVANLKIGYAGTGDLWCNLEGVPTLIDFKTGYVDDFGVSLQLTAYANAEFIITPAGERLEPIYVEQLAVLGTSTDGEYVFKFLPFDIASFFAVLHTFNAMRVKSHCLPACPLCGGKEPT
jgi:hypothetical protein